MNAIQEIFRRHGADYCRQFVTTPAQRKVIAAISHCRTEGMGRFVYWCENCPHQEMAYRSCGNRHCPGCDAAKGAKWLAVQLDKKLPCPYFMLTFTIPEELRPLAMFQPEKVYDAMMTAAAESLKALAKDPRHVGADRLGFTSILHTWGRQMQFHPHVHMVVPGGGLNADESEWMNSRIDFFVPVRALSRIFRGKLLALLDNDGLGDQIPDGVRTEPWVVHSQAAGSGENVLKYLARYVFRVAVSAERILKVSDTHVVVGYKKVGSNRQRRMTLEVFEFIRRYLQHVLPTGFTKVRHYGFLHPNSGIATEDVRERVEEKLDPDFTTAPPPSVDIDPLPPPRCCPRCQVPLKVMCILPSYRTRPTEQPPAAITVEPQLELPMRC
jgi:Putative transposase/Transposase zinc-binding domain